ncbi:CHAT domain-containing protein [Nostoc sp.]|uniref:CHAT domain-containing protein n=1 Tax=Nostoc sp. TaxID=1180 RepID=UPI002FF63F07
MQLRTAIIAGKTKAQALQFAQVKMLANSEYARPLYWASYVLVGESVDQRRYSNIP